MRRRNSTHRSWTSLRLYRAVTIARAFEAYLSATLASDNTMRSSSASATSSSMSARPPVSRCSTKSTIPVARVATTGTDVANASSTTVGSPSRRLGRHSTSVIAKYGATSVTSPAKVTEFVAARNVSKSASLDSSVPPTIKSCTFRDGSNLATARAKQFNPLSLFNLPIKVITGLSLAIRNDFLRHAWATRFSRAALKCSRSTPLGLPNPKTLIFFGSHNCSLTN